MRRGALAALSALLLASCASFEVSTPDGLTIKSSAYGRGALAVDSLADGTMSIIVCQDGTSDWSIGRMFAFIGELAAPIFGGSGQDDDMQSPDSAASCKQIVESAADPVGYDPPPTDEIRLMIRAETRD